MTEDTHPSIARIIESGSRRFQAARTLDEQRAVQREHLTAVATTMAELAILDAGAEPDLPADDAKSMLRNGLAFVTVNTAILLEAHGLGEPLVPEGEREALAEATFRGRIHALMLAGRPGGRA